MTPKLCLWVDIKLQFPNIWRSLTPTRICISRNTNTHTNNTLTCNNGQPLSSSTHTHSYAHSNRRCHQLNNNNGHPFIPTSISHFPFSRFPSLSTDGHPRSHLANWHHQVAWIKADAKAILAIHEHVITNNDRLSVQHNDYNTWTLNIRSVKMEDSGKYMCQVNTDPMKMQVSLAISVRERIDIPRKNEPFVFLRCCNNSQGYRLCYKAKGAIHSYKN